MNDPNVLILQDLEIQAKWKSCLLIQMEKVVWNKGYCKNSRHKTYHMLINIMYPK